MKLRIKDNSLRLRLTRGEVDALAGEGRVASAVHFPGGARLEYAIESAPGQALPAAEYAGDGVRVIVPEAAVHDWASSGEVAISGQQSLGPDTLSILVEKDFACLTPREGEDESDMFPHPLQDLESC